MAAPSAALLDRADVAWAGRRSGGAAPAIPGTVAAIAGTAVGAWVRPGRMDQPKAHSGSTSGLDCRNKCARAGNRGEGRYVRDASSLPRYANGCAGDHGPDGPAGPMAL